MSMYHEVMEALTPLVDAFEQLGIAYYIGGSVSSSLHGLARRTQDVDVIADIRSHQVRLLVQRLQPDYYVDEQAWQDAVRRGLPYSVIHLDTMVKIDLMPLKQRAFTREEASRAQAHVLEAGMRPVRVASAEDAILTKLEWFEMGGHSSSRHYMEYTDPFTSSAGSGEPVRQESEFALPGSQSSIGWVWVPQELEPRPVADRAFLAP